MPTWRALFPLTTVVYGNLVVQMQLKSGAGFNPPNDLASDWTLNLAGVPGQSPLGTIGGMAYQEPNAVSITGGTITGLNASEAPGDVVSKAYFDAGDVIASQAEAEAGLQHQEHDAAACGAINYRTRCC